ncbi:MAG: MerR family transcriptional regulator, partial [Bryobacteraceae bacterium]
AIATWGASRVPISDWGAAWRAGCFEKLLDLDVTSEWNMRIGKGNPLPELNRKDWYQAREFAELAGVTVRTLHHYDRLGLLKPHKRSSAGYRLYRLADLERIEQIVALKFLALPLAEIRQVLDRHPLSLAQALARQRVGLLEKRRLIDRALAAMRDVETAMAESKPTAVLLRRIIEAIEMQNDSNWMMKYYSPEAQAKIAERAKTFTPEMQEQVSQAWKDYYRDLAALKDQEDPDGVKAADLAKRHRELVAAFTGNDPEVEAGLKALYQDRADWPADMQERMKEHEG